MNSTPSSLLSCPDQRFRLPKRQSLRMLYASRIWPFGLRYLICALTVLCAPAVTAAQLDHNRSMTLLEVYETARESNPALAIAQFTVDRQEAEKDIARGQLFPQLSVFGDWSENEISYEGNALTQRPAENYPGERYGLQLRAPLFNIRSVREYQRRNLLLGQSQEELLVAEADLLAKVVQAYLNLLLTAENVSLFKNEVVALEGQFDEMSALYAKSLVPVTTVLETQTRLDGVRADLVDARGQEAIARQSLSQLIGIYDVELVSASDSIYLMSTSGSEGAAAELAIQNDPTIKAAEKSVQASRKGVEREKGSWWPELDFVYSNQYSDVGFDNLSSLPRSTESYSISLRYPLFEGFAGSARLRAEWAQFYTAQQQLEAVKREVDGRARAAWVNLLTATERVRAAAQASKTSETNLDAARKAVRAGTARVTDVLLALAQNTRSKRDLNEARFLKALSWLELEIVTGGDPQMLASQMSTALHRPR